MNKKNIVSGAIILTVAGVITRLMGFVYRVYMSNVIGAEGMGLYQLIMPIYTLVWSLSCSGITTTISKLTAQEKAKGEYGNVKLILMQGLMVSGLISIFLSFVTFFYAPFISVHIFKDARIILSVKILSLAFPFMAIGSCLRGYFYGLQNTIVPAINQVLEQSVRMFVVWLLVGTLIPLGIEYACAAAIIGIVAEEVFSLLYILIAYRKLNKKIYSDSSHKKYDASLTQKASFLLVMSMSLPLTANRVTSSLLSTYENILIPQRLQMYGMSSSEAIASFGQIMGMVFPLIFFPSAFLISLSISLVPAISEASAMKKHSDISSTITKCMLFAAVIGFGSATLFVTFPSQIGYFIYNQDITRMLMLTGLVCPFLYMQIILSGVLNGLGYQMFLFKNSILSSIINILFIFFLVPKFGMDAFIFGFLFSASLISFIYVRKLNHTIDLKFEFGNWFLKPLLCGVASSSVSKLLAYAFILPNFNELIGLLLSITLLSILYITFIILIGCLSLYDITQLIVSIKPTGKTRKHMR